MHRLFHVLLALAVCAAAHAQTSSGGGLTALSTRSFTNSGLGSDPNTLSLSASTITVDLSAIQGAQVFRATLDPYRTPEFWHDRQDFYAITDVSRAAYDIRPPAEPSLALRGPRYLTLDATAAVQAAIASGQLTLQILDPGPGFGPTVSLDVLCDRPAPTAIVQVQGVSARHESGDTMLTFTEVDPPHIGATWTVAGYTNAVLHTYAPNATPKRRYRVYRSTQPFDSLDAIAAAQLIDEILPGSCWNHALHGLTDMQFVDGFEQSSLEIPTLPTDDMQPASPSTGIYVHRATSAAAAHYLVSYVVDGAEDFSTLVGNTAGPVVEATGNGMVLQWREQVFTDGWLFSPDRNPTFRWYVRWEAPPYWNLPSRPCNYRVGLPQAPHPNPALNIELHALFGNIDGWRQWRDYDAGSVLMTLSHLRYNSYTAFSECMETLRPWDAGTVQPYFYARSLSFIFDFLVPEYNIDLERVSLSGGSMGGAGTIMWGLRSGHVFAYLASAVGNSVPAEDITWEYENWGGYGPLAWQLLFSNEQLARFGYPLITATDNYVVWDYFDSDQWLAANPGVETPYISFSNAPNDGAIGWDQAWRVAQRIHSERRPHNFSWGQQGHGQPVEAVAYPFVLNQSLPAFSNCSLDDDLGAAPGASVPAGQRNRYLRWDLGTVSDLPNEWAVDLWLDGSSPQPNATVDVTPRKLQHLIHEPGDTYLWRLLEAGVEIASGVAGANNDGLVTVPDLPVVLNTRRLVLTRHDGVLAIAVPNPPTLLTPAATTAFAVEILAGSEMVVPGSPTLHYRFAGGSFETTPLLELGGGSYEAVLPAAVCGDAPEFYVSANGSQSGLRTAPLNAPNELFAAPVGELGPTTVLEADFEGGLPVGWSATGLWHPTSACAINPVCDGASWAYFGDDGSCTYDTGTAESGLLTAPMIDLTGVPQGRAVTLTFCSNLESEADANYDFARVLVNGAVVADVADGAAWETVSVDLSPYAGQVIELAWSFDTVDDMFNEFRGWQLDDVRVSAVQVTCVDHLLGDVDGDVDVDGHDGATLMDCLAGPSAAPLCGAPTAGRADVDGDGDVDARDVAVLQLLVGS